MITDFRKWVTYLGNADTPTYTFPFKIKSSSDIVVVQLDVSLTPPKIDWVERGNVQINIQSIAFDPVMGGGSITFAANLAVGKRIYIKLADDAPTQTVQFREQIDFKLRAIENALDFIVNQTTRLSDKTQRSLRFADFFSHVESTVNLEMQEFPMAFGIPIMDSQAIQLNMKPFLTILTEQGTQAQINKALADAAAALAATVTLGTRMTTAEGNITTLQTTVADHGVRITNLENAAGGSSGPGAIRWYAPAITGAVLGEHKLLEAFLFSKGAQQSLRSVIERTVAATTVQKTLTIGWTGTSDNVKWTLTTRLIKPTQTIDSTIHTHIHSVESTISGTDRPMTTTLQISDAAGLINGQSITNGDKLVLTLTRENAAGVEVDQDVQMYQTLTKVNML